MSEPHDIPFGYCHCGCGQKTELATRSRSATGIAKGDPYRYLPYHRRTEPDFVVDENGCWIWQKSRWGRRGAEYGSASDAATGGMVPAHRLLYELVRGPIPDGLVIDHLCRVTLCVNPDHLEPVTNAENVLRGESMVAQQARATHCKRGHPLSGDNLYRRANGGRECRKCTSDRNRSYYLAKLARGEPS